MADDLRQKPKTSEALGDRDELEYRGRFLDLEYYELKSSEASEKKAA